MRYDTPIYFQFLERGAYNEDTGNYDDDVTLESMRYASVMDTKTETMKLIYGDIKQRSLTLTLQNHYPTTFDYIRIGEKRYRVDHSRELRHKQTFIVSEVQ